MNYANTERELKQYLDGKNLSFFFIQLKIKNITAEQRFRIVR